MSEEITISSEILEDMFIDDNYEDVGKFVDPNGKFTGWHITADHETGDFDGSKSSMVDFEVYLYNDKDEYMGQAIGGYYNFYAGYSFSYDLTFEPPAPETPESKFREFLSEIVEDEISLDKMIKKIEKQIKKVKNGK